MAQHSQQKDLRVETNLAKKNNPSSIGGWLLLLIVGMTLLGPVVGLIGISRYFLYAEVGYAPITTNPDWQAYKHASYIAFLLFSVASIYGGFALLRRKESSAIKVAQIAIWISGPIASIALDFFIPMATFGENGINPPTALRNLLLTSISAIVWHTYLSKSKRVQTRYIIRSHNSRDADL